MKSKPFNKKLDLKKTTISQLDGDHLTDVKGGGPIITYPLGVCQGTVNATICFTDCGGQMCLSH
jgi:hypothetical protein